MKKAKLDKTKRIRIYLENHPEVFTQELCQELADRFLNVNTIRKTIKQEFPRWLKKNRNNFYVIADNEQWARNINACTRPLPVWENHCITKRISSTISRAALKPLSERSLRPYFITCSTAHRFNSRMVTFWFFPGLLGIPFIAKGFQWFFNNLKSWFSGEITD